MIRGVLFDYGGVYAEEGFSALLRRLAELSNKSYEKVFDIGFNKICIEDGFATGKVSEYYFWETILREIGLKNADIDELRAYMFRSFEPRENLQKLVDHLRDRYPVALLSDQTAWLDELDRIYSIYPHFDYVFVSYKIGLSKQEPEIWDLVSSKMNLSPDGLLFIDDSLKNIQIAKKKGIKAHLYSNFDCLLRNLKKLGLMDSSQGTGKR